MKTKLIKYLLVIQFLLINVVLFAQTDPGSDDGLGGLEGGGDTTPAAPINNYVWVLALVGLLFVFVKFRSIQNKKIKD